MLKCNKIFYGLQLKFFAAFLPNFQIFESDNRKAARTILNRRLEGGFLLDYLNIFNKFC